MQQGAGIGGEEPEAPPERGGAIVLVVLVTTQFILSADSTFMTVSATVVGEDLGVPATRIDAAIATFTMVVAASLLAGAKLGAILGTRTSFRLGCCTFALGAGVTALAPSFWVLVLGWSVLEGLGVALVRPAIVGVVGHAFPEHRRAVAFGMLAAASAAAYTLAPLLGGAVTTFLSWRWGFALEVVVIAGIASFARSLPQSRQHWAGDPDWIGVVLSVSGLVVLLVGVLRSSLWGWIHPTPGGVSIFGFSPVLPMVVTGCALCVGFIAWERRREVADRPSLLRPSWLERTVLSRGLIVIAIVYGVEAGAFVLVPLMLTVALGRDALTAGIWILPGTIALLLAALVAPRKLPRVPPRTSIRIGTIGLIMGSAILGVVLLRPSPAPADALLPLLLIGAGVGLMAPQLSTITLAQLDRDHSVQAGGLQNTAAAVGGALGAGFVQAVILLSLSIAVFGGVQAAIEQRSDAAAAAQAHDDLASALDTGVPMLTDRQLEAELKQAGVDPALTSLTVGINSTARLRSLAWGCGLLTLASIVALLLTGPLPREAIPSRATSRRGET